METCGFCVKHCGQSWCVTEEKDTDKIQEILHNKWEEEMMGDIEE